MTETESWTGAFAAKDGNTFADAFAENIVLEATALRAPITGRARVSLVMGTASRLYESLTFTHEATNGPRSYVEWEAVAFGGTKLSGSTILVRDADGRIERAIIQHRPLDGLLEFSAKMGEALAGTDIDPASFHQPS